MAPDSFTGDPFVGRALAGALAAMKKEHRDVLLPHAIADLSHEEIGVALGVPVGTVKGWLHRAPRETRANTTSCLARSGWCGGASETWPVRPGVVANDWFLVLVPWNQKKRSRWSRGIRKGSRLPERQAPTFRQGEPIPTAVAPPAPEG